jgi:hypothetical protein
MVYHIDNYVIGHTEGHFYCNRGLTLDGDQVIQRTELTAEVALTAYLDSRSIDRFGVGWMRVDVVTYEAHNTDPH